MPLLFLNLPEGERLEKRTYIRLSIFTWINSLVVLHINCQFVWNTSYILITWTFFGCKLNMIIYIVCTIFYLGCHFRLAYPSYLLSVLLRDSEKIFLTYDIACKLEAYLKVNRVHVHYIIWPTKLFVLENLKRLHYRVIYNMILPGWHYIILRLSLNIFELIFQTERLHVLHALLDGL